MPKASGPRRQGRNVAAVSLVERRGDYRVQYTSWYYHAAEALGKGIKPAITAEIESFTNDWRKGLSDQELNAKWDYKTPKGKDARRAEAKQIRIRIAVLGSYRAILTALPETKCLCVVDVFVKSSTSTSRELPLAIKRAQDVQDRGYCA